jgi:hypothetical protein
VYSVVFIDWNNRVLKTERVRSGDSATPPENPERNGYEFRFWEGNFRNVSTNLIIKAIYDEDEPVDEVYSVVFIDWDNRVLKTERVRRGDSATPPENPERNGV